MDILAQTVDSGGSDIAPWAQIGASGAIIGLFIWTITKAWPALLQSHRDELKDVRAWHDKEVGAVRQDAREERETFERCVKEFTDATVQVLKQQKP